MTTITNKEKVTTATVESNQTAAQPKGRWVWIQEAPSSSVDAAREALKGMSLDEFGNFGSDCSDREFGGLGLHELGFGGGVHYGYKHNDFHKFHHGQRHHKHGHGCKKFKFQHWNAYEPMFAAAGSYGETNGTQCQNAEEHAMRREKMWKLKHEFWLKRRELWQQQFGPNAAGVLSTTAPDKKNI
ncbi:hypothetical protein HK100_003274 [Physocladia obscura]|uniref:Uncharacterized protein n=1 Tax=Physocladia obscura TaxID=109957 RepID=A0AAD5XAJ6_9FUNG|nr:hypothetical protein HK100_003274 [Physocladia obscura]